VISFVVVTIRTAAKAFLRPSAVPAPYSIVFEIMMHVLVSISIHWCLFGILLTQELNHWCLVQSFFGVAAELQCYTPCMIHNPQIHKHSLIQPLVAGQDLSGWWLFGVLSICERSSQQPL
jgi:hypothetical protein